MNDINITPGITFLLAETVSCRLSRRADCFTNRVCVKLTVSRAMISLLWQSARGGSGRRACALIFQSVIHSFIITKKDKR